jgi:hypothetical protein
LLLKPLLQDRTDKQTLTHQLSLSFLSDLLGQLRRQINSQLLWLAAVPLNLLSIEIADKDGMTMLFKNSDWSEMEEWVQKICRAVFDE